MLQHRIQSSHQKVRIQIIICIWRQCHISKKGEFASRLHVCTFYACASKILLSCKLKISFWGIFTPLDRDFFIIRFITSVCNYWEYIIIKPVNCQYDSKPVCCLIDNLFSENPVESKMKIKYFKKYLKKGKRKNPDILAPLIGRRGSLIPASIKF